MKRLLLFVLFITGVGYSQSFELSGFGGVGASTLWGVRFPLPGTTPIVGANAGIAAGYNFPDIAVVRMDLFYDRKGYINESNSQRVDLDYFIINPQLQLHTMGKVDLYFSIGPWIGVLLNKSYSHTNVDGGILFGLGYRQNLYKKKMFLFIEAKEYWGLARITTDIHGNSNKFQGSLGLSYRF